MNGLFDNASLFVKLDCMKSVHDFSRNVVNGLVTKDKIDRIEDGFALFQQACTIEHEFFHFRNFVSSSIGYGIFYSNQLKIQDKNRIFRLNKNKEFTEVYAKYSTNGIIKKKFKNVPDDFFHYYISYNINQSFTDLLFTFSNKEFDLLYNEEFIHKNVVNFKETK